MKPRPRSLAARCLAGGLFLLSGCAGDHSRDARPGGDEGPQLIVPFFADRRDQWGPAALAGVLGYWRRPASPSDLRREIHFPKQRGSVALDLRNAARAHGLRAEMSTGTLAGLKTELDAGRPVIVLVNTGFRLVPVRSFMVVTGYNEWLGGVYAHFGPNKDAFLAYSRFEEDWKKAGRWILLMSEALPADKPEIKSQTSETAPIAPVAAAAPARVEKRPRPRAECLPAPPAADAAAARCAPPVMDAAAAPGSESSR